MVKSFTFSLLFLLTILKNQRGSCTQFPMLDFLQTATKNVSWDGVQDYKRIKSSFYSCKGGNNKCCDCSLTCMLTRTCCIDKFWDASNPVPLNQYLDSYLSEFRKIKELSCLSVIPFDEKSYRKIFYKMVATCVDGVDGSDADRCIDDGNLQDQERIPVFGADNYLYKNAYCARCNLIKTYYTVDLLVLCENRFKVLVPFTPQEEGVTTTPAPKKNILKEFSVCEISIKSNFKNRQHLVECSPNQIIEPECRNPKYQDYCNMYKGTFGSSKNIHCRICNGGRYNAIEFPNDCRTRLPSKRFTWSVTISFSSGSTQIEARGRSGSDSQTYCEAGEIYNFIDGSCKKFICAPGYRVEGTTCVQEVNFRKSVSVINPGYSRCLTAANASLYVVVNKPSNNFNLSSFTMDFQNDFGTVNEEFERVNTSSDSQMLFRRKYYIIGNDYSAFEAKLKNSSLRIWKNGVDIFIASSFIRQITHFYNFDLSRHYSNHRVCAVKNSYTITSGKFTKSCGYQQNNSVILDYSDLSLYTLFTEDSVTETISHCNLYHLTNSCPTVLISTNYTMDSKTDILTVIDHNNETFSYSPHEYLPASQGFRICAKETPSASPLTTTYGWQKPLNDTEFYLGVVVTCISIVFGLLFILTFVLFRELRNRGGMNVLIMSICVLMSDIFYLIGALAGPSSETLCKVIGMLLHWGMLMVEIWAVVLAVDLTYHLLTPHTSTAKHTTKRMLSRITVCFLPVTAVVLICIVLNETDTLKLGYGVNGICWITSYYSRLAFYLIPTVVSFLVSFVCLLCLLCHLYREERSQRKNLRDSGRTNVDLVSIALKLIVVLGLTEIVGFVHISKSLLSENELISNASFGLIYSLTRSLRGTLIFFLYLGNKKTWNLYKGRFSADVKSDTTELRTRVTKFSNLMQNSAESSPNLSVR